MEQTPFFIAGGILVVLALAVSFFGLRNENFPPSRGAMMAGIALFALVVVGTATAAVINAARMFPSNRNSTAMTSSAPSMRFLAIVSIVRSTSSVRS